MRYFLSLILTFCAIGFVYAIESEQDPLPSMIHATSTATSTIDELVTPPENIISSESNTDLVAATVLSVLGNTASSTKSPEEKIVEDILNSTSTEIISLDTATSTEIISEAPPELIVQEISGISLVMASSSLAQIHPENASNGKGLSVTATGGFSAIFLGISDKNFRMEKALGDDADFFAKDLFLKGEYRLFLMKEGACDGVKTCADIADVIVDISVK